MKKLLLIAIFSVGIFTISNAQFCIYKIVNHSGSSWDVELETTGGVPLSVTHSGIPAQSSSSPVTGAMGPGFTFPLIIKGNNTNGCDFFEKIPFSGVGDGYQISPDCSVEYVTYELMPGIFGLEIHLSGL